ncbi:hypothetical protein [Phenylobacterium sp.]|uniref:hypothetical protein n=1 Tax=Phenylobacterium sp. TaxID=1871053 RepID=UPI002E2FA21B|nr:hypothetical protein [Phenylobacterium sp.]HEX2561115.1 hypothetical protein [Phenylobacterium sp.]
MRSLALTRCGARPGPAAHWASPEGILHLVFTSRRGLRPSVRATLDVLAAALRSDSPAWQAQSGALL